MSYLFVSGFDRSGTIALTRVLNLHPEVSLGMERYKFLLNDEAKLETLNKNRFKRERFSDIKEVETYIDCRRQYDAVNDKYYSSMYIGDKNPRYFWN